MPLINSPVAPFKAIAFHNGKFVEITEQTLKGRWSVFVFYPADFTFVCPTELEDLADRHDQFKALGVDVYAISTDTHFAHKAWHDTSDAIRKVRYPLIGDPTGRISRSFDVLVTEYTPIAGAVGDLATVSVTWQISGAITKDVTP